MNHRQRWHEAIRDYCGIRDREEFEALRHDGAFDKAIWIDASARHPPEPVTSMNLTIVDADIVIDNNGSEADLRRHLDELMAAWAITPFNSVRSASRFGDEYASSIHIPPPAEPDGVDIPGRGGCL